MQITIGGKAILNKVTPETATHYAESLFREILRGYVFKKIAIINCGYVSVARH